jgi:hypothetical protein
MMAMLANIEASLNHEIELYDSGASHHMSPYRNKFLNFVSIKPKTIQAVDGQEFEATGLGDMHIELPNGQSKSWILLKNVLYTPAMGLILVSISKIAKAGFTTVFHKNILKIIGPRDSILGTIDVCNGLYHVDHESYEIAASATMDTVTIEDLHKRLGHISPEVAKKMVEDNLVVGVKLNKSSNIQSCYSCEYAKAHRKPIWKEQELPCASKLGEEVHSDVWEPAPVQTINGRNYYGSFTDDFSQYTHLYLLRTKGQVFDAYKAYEAEFMTQRKASIKKLRSDQGGEYLSGPFDNHLSKAGTLQILTIHDTPKYNGVSERLNHTLLKKVQAMLHASQLPKFL